MSMMVASCGTGWVSLGQRTRPSPQDTPGAERWPRRWHLSWQPRNDVSVPAAGTLVKLHRLSFLLGCQSCQSAQHVPGGVCGHPVGWLEPQCLCTWPRHAPQGTPPPPAEAPEAVCVLRTESTGLPVKAPHDPTLRWQAGMGTEVSGPPGEGGQALAHPGLGGTHGQKAGAPAEVPSTACWTSAPPSSNLASDRTCERGPPTVQAGTPGKAPEGSAL